MKYNTELCAFLDLKNGLRQEYTDVITQVYPLRANPGELKSFCEKYLNGNPFLEFTPVGSLIMMQVCKYTKMSSASDQQNGSRTKADRSFGQHELAFGIPLRCFEKSQEKEGTPKFRDLAMAYPFIFVDNPLSMEGGRQIYGWSKAGIRFNCTDPEFQPNEPRCLVSGTFKSPGLQSLPDTLLEVHQRRPFLSGRSGVAAALTSIPTAIGGYLAATSGFLDMLGGLISDYKLPSSRDLSKDIIAAGVDVRSLGEVMQRWYGNMNALVPTFLGMALGRADSSTQTGGPEMTIFTMKQVRDAVNPTNACYQAIVESKMKVTDLKDGGLLFDPLSGDSTGGIEINLRSNNEYIKQLIKVLSPLEKTTDGKEVEAISLRPVIPFWEKVNLTYGLANYQCWRTGQTAWRGEGEPATQLPGKTPEETGPIKYIPRGSGAALEITGRRVASNAVLHFFPLSATRKTLQDLVDRYLNKLADQKEDRFSFQIKTYPEPPNIYVTLLSYDKMKIGKSEPVYSDRVLTFAALVDYYSETDRSGKGIKDSLHHAFIPFYTFVGTDWNFISEYEIYGRLTFKSELVSPANTWIRESAPDRCEHEVLTLLTTLFPDQSEGQAARQAPFIGVYSEPEFDSSDPAILSGSAATKHLRKLGLDQYLRPEGTPAEEQESLSIALKQVRNAIQCESADYQSLVGIERAFTYKEKKIKQMPLKIRIYSYQSFQIVQELGLEGGEMSEDGSSVAFKVPEAFSIAGDLIEEQGKELWRRVAPKEAWEKVSGA